ncbi:hypothetical protein NQ176_g10225 [Zarea fungicola]|uniref:Uncharacterized protein n=1 Tax=Zarea fungicola TaxID=93591 RepID=A0ACC1MJ43_9HYPO|nr:hypothetical protein NQ176_g10225 [Lecanicillium fungicola]
MASNVQVDEPFSHAASQEPPPVQRKKRWATKTRSGCQTCRASMPSSLMRRGHWAPDGTCDEISSRVMDYASTNGPLQMTSGIELDTRWRDADIAIHARPGAWTASLGLAKVPLRLVPGQWQVFEAIEFFNSIVAQEAATHSLIESKHDAACATEPGHPSNDIIIAFALAARIVVIAAMHDSELRPSECYNTAHLWVRLYRLMETSLAKVNHDLQQPAHASSANAVESKVFQRIADMMSVEYMLRVPGWRAHLEGLLSYLKLTGGPRAWMGLKVGLDNAIHKAVV